jgi:FtsP/CotA-like multicopper oxidase with cupredoxin domain
MARLRVVVGAACVVAAGWLVGARDGAGDRASVIEPNDNRRAAGELRDGVLSIQLVAARGAWYPEAHAGPAHDVYAFGESRERLSNPGPLLRVPVGTEVRARVRSEIEGAPLIVHGLHDRPGVADTIHVPAGGVREIRFRLSAPGTYLYWATTRGAPTLRDRFGPESQLHGALIVDPAGAVPSDRIFVIGIEDDSAALPGLRPLHAAVVNGRSWPHSERATVTAGDTVHMRWINATDRMHPMHLHGFHFRVDSRGDGVSDTIFDAARQRLAVTELLGQGQTFSLTWVPDRPGNWLVHCHMADHISPELRRGASAHAARGHDVNHALDVMSGIVIGWTVLPRGSPEPVRAMTDAPRRLRLLVQSVPALYGADAGLGFVLQSGDAEPRADSVVIPGPPIVLTRGEPVRITVVNRLAEPTSIHWHGIELESWFDGVSGWSGAPGRTAPHIAAGDSFDVRFTPPRAGTFIYHSHFEEKRQLSSGMYGPLIVLEPGASYDAERDRSWVLAQGGPAPNAPVVLNGDPKPVIDLEAGRRYRIRLININPSVPLTVSLLEDSVPVSWHPIAKDGADLPPAHAQARQATLTLGVGEAYDFQLVAERPRELRLRAVNPAGIFRLDAVVRVHAAR